MARGGPDLTAAVVDANVVIKLFLPEDDSERATELIRGRPGSAPVTRSAPGFLYIECGTILWKRVRRGLLPGVEAANHLRALMTRGVELFSDEIIADRALRYQISVYDAAYVAQADLLDLPFVTADERLLRRIGGSSDRYLLLAGLR